jgi:hypothetical protein
MSFIRWRPRHGPGSFPGSEGTRAGDTSPLPCHFENYLAQNFENYLAHADQSGGAFGRRAGHLENVRQSQIEMAKQIG